MQSSVQCVFVWWYLEWLLLLPLCSRFLLSAPSVQQPPRFPPRQSTLNTAETIFYAINEKSDIKRIFHFHGLFWGNSGPKLCNRSTFWPAGNSRVQHPMGGRNCFTITTQSLWSVRFSRAIIPTPAGKTCYSRRNSTSNLTVSASLSDQPSGKETKQKRKRTRSPSASVLLRLVVLFTVSQVLVDEKREWNCARATCMVVTLSQSKAERYLVFPAGSTYVVFSSFTHFPAAMSCNTEFKRTELIWMAPNATRCSVITLLYSEAAQQHLWNYDVSYYSTHPTATPYRGNCLTEKRLCGVLKGCFLWNARKKGIKTQSFYVIILKMKGQFVLFVLLWCFLP